MCLSTLIAGVFAAATSVVASPTQRLEPARGLAGNVLDANMKAYMLQDTEKGNVRSITDKINGEFMRPVSFHIEPGHACKFYSEATRGIGYPLGEHEGPVDGNFDKDWAAFYECWHTAEKPLSEESVLVVKSRDSPIDTDTMIPCGYVRTPTGAQMYLNESGKQQMVDFAINGDPYTPSFYHVSKNCDCRFFSSLGGRSGPEMLLEAHGPTEGGFGDKKAVQYRCWIRI
ncbi:Nn.00g019720.m01.CDS01 [Neocucurbitaria sp. VM-36]